MDAVAVSISSGMSRGARASWRDAFAMAGVFGVLQALMPALGYVGGQFFEQAIRDWDHWVVFAILVAIGAKMIRESFAKDEDRPRGNPFAPRSLLLLGLATSLDAAAVGLTLALLDVPPLMAAVFIGLVTFALCVPAVRLGGRLGIAFAHRAELAGGLVLVAIGTKILLEHLSH